MNWAFRGEGAIETIAITPNADPGGSWYAELPVPPVTATSHESFEKRIGPEATSNLPLKMVSRRTRTTAKMMCSPMTLGDL